MQRTCTIPTCSVLLAASLAVCLPQLRGQQTAAQPAPSAAAKDTAPVAYDVVSIKPSKDPRRGNIDISVNDDLFSARDISLRTLLAVAYTLNRDLIFGLPDRPVSAHFDIEAKVLDPDRAALYKLTREQRGAMLEPMLAERFQLEAHTEIRTLPIYELIVLKNGPKFQPAVHHTGSTGLGVHNAHMNGTDVTMAQLAEELSGEVHRTVVDHTGLAGKYDFSCEWLSPHAPASSPEDSEASLLTALQEQLGLKLRSTRGPVTVLVVDHVQMPSPD